MAAPNYIKFDDLKLPLLEDSASIQVAISKITAAFLSSRIDARRTGLLLYAVQIASQNIDRDSERENTDIVHSMTVTDEGDEMAPEKEVCEPSDCPSCNRRDTCDNYDPGEEDEKPGAQLRILGPERSAGAPGPSHLGTGESAHVRQ